ncbi:MAG: ATP-binding cassette domain-containing protein [Bacteroidota bacterium]
MLEVQIESISIKDGSNLKSVLRDVGFRIHANSIFSILGKNGQGKSLLIKSLTNLLDKNMFDFTGSIKLNGIDLSRITEHDLIEIRKNKIRYCFQDAVNSFDPLRKMEYYFKSINCSLADIEAKLAYFNLPAYNILSNKYIYEFSIGEAQRINICLALLAEPELLILDEPTSALDVVNINLLVNKLKEYKHFSRNKILLITQDIKFANVISDEIKALHDGRLHSPDEINIFRGELRHESPAS